MNNFKWTKLIGIVGLLAGGFSAASHNIAHPLEILGFALPYVVLFLIMGLVIDLVAGKIK